MVRSTPHYLRTDRTKKLKLDRWVVIDVDYRIVKEFFIFNNLGQLIYRSKSAQIRSSASYAFLRRQNLRRKKDDVDPRSFNCALLEGIYPPAPRCHVQMGGGMGEEQGGREGGL